MWHFIFTFLKSRNIALFSCSNFPQEYCETFCFVNKTAIKNFNKRICNAQLKSKWKSFKSELYAMVLASFKSEVVNFLITSRERATYITVARGFTYTRSKKFRIWSVFKTWAIFFYFKIFVLKVYFCCYISSEAFFDYIQYKQNKSMTDIGKI